MRLSPWTRSAAARASDRPAETGRTPPRRTEGPPPLRADEMSSWVSCAHVALAIGSRDLGAQQPLHSKRDAAANTRPSGRRPWFKPSGALLGKRACVVKDERGRNRWLQQKARITGANPRARTAAARRKRSATKFTKELERLHAELVKLQLWAVAEGLKVFVVFEGRDGAGKGGVIKAITERVSPRVFRVIALPAPDRAGEVADVHAALYSAHSGGRRNRLFDRSWYNRAGVERVMEFCSMD